MQGHTHERAINVALGETLDELRRSWNVGAEQAGHVLRGGGRPDLLVQDASGWPVAIEADRSRHGEAEKDAVARLGRIVQHNGRTIETAIALVYPPELQTLDGAALRKAIRSAGKFEYALYTNMVNRAPDRLPASGWLTGNLRDLAILVHRAAAPAPRVDALASELESGVEQAADLFTLAHHYGSDLGKQVAEALGQTDDEDGQSRRMAMTVVANALVFHEALALADFQVENGGQPRKLRSVGECMNGSLPMPTQIKAEWESILKKNHWPIFYTANRIMTPIPTATAVNLLGRLWETVEKLIAGGLTRSHDLMGIVFQRLIADRKFLATFYTRPAAATLLAGLAMPEDRPPSRDWGDAKALSTVQVGDFACGTGTLLSAAYQRISLLHELHGGDPRALHRHMMQRGLVGLDVLNIGVHLTAAMLAGSHPDTPFDGECLLTMPYGKQRDGVAIGSLDLLAYSVQPSFIKQAVAVTAGGRGPEEISDLISRVGHRQFDLVIMNPPFTRPGGQEGRKKGTGNPAFAAFETTRQVQREMTASLRSLRSDRPLAGGNAGLAADFLDLAMRKVKKGGSIAMVLPLSAVSGQEWENARNRLVNSFQKITVVTISGSGAYDSAFSADTGMADCLIVCSGKRNSNGIVSGARGAFVVLNRIPESMQEGELLAAAVQEVIADQNVRKLEDFSGGTPLRLGALPYGNVIDAPLPSDGPWPVAGVADLELAQAANRLAEGLFRLNSLTPAPVAIPVALIKDIADRGPYHMDIYWDNADGVPQGPFELLSPPAVKAPTYPMLWAHQAARERTLVVEPDAEGRVKVVTQKYRSVIERRARKSWGLTGETLTPDLLRSLSRRFEAAAEELLTDAGRIWQTATRAHYNRDLRFNSQSLIAAMTERKSIGGHAWPSVIFDNPGHEYAFALWSNSTLGLLMHWWVSNKTQSGRGRMTVTGIPDVPTLDTRALSKEQHAAAKRAFQEMKSLRFLPFDQIDQDPARAQLDRRLLVDVLGLTPSLCEPGGPVDLLRRKLAAEPQIHGGKKTRVLFYEDFDHNGRVIHRERKEARKDR